MSHRISWQQRLSRVVWYNILDLYMRLMFLMVSLFYK